VEWIEMPFAGERLESVVHFGSGKDSELRLVFATGRRVTLAVSAVRVAVDLGVVVDVSGWDDVSLRIEYLGPNLNLHSGRFGFEVDDDFDAEFAAEARSWVCADCEGQLDRVVRAEIRLTSTPSCAGSTTRVG
jgi:hypothetical protein